MAEQHPDNVVVVMVPLPAQGHLNQLLHLTRIISTRGLAVHFIGSATHNRQAKDRVHGWDPSTVSNIHFHDFQLPQFVTPPPDPNAVVKFPAHLQPTFEASLHLRGPLGLLLRSLSCAYRRVVTVHDSLMAFAAEEASFVPNVEAYSFVSCSAFAVHHIMWDLRGKPADQEGIVHQEEENQVGYMDCFTEKLLEFSARNSQWLDYRAGDIFNTCNATEDRYINLVAGTQPGKPLWCVGPFNPVTINLNGGPRDRCLEWLDQQAQKSVIYVSFGTMTSVSDEQIAELAIGLERSEQRFIWVLRDADRGDIYSGEVRKAQVPEGFEERTKGVGMIVREWAPQLQILGHPSTGGFMSHCGWNSSMESLSMGVPIAAWPMHSDQPMNALLITEVLKVGLFVRKWSCRGEVVSAKSVESCVRKLMVSEEGDMMRKRAHELGVDIRRAVSDGGTSAAHLESFLTHISR